MSSAQIRAHYILYPEWALPLGVVDDLNLGESRGRSRAEMIVEWGGFAEVLATVDPTANLVALLSHSIPGLVRLGLLENEYHFGPNDRPDQAPYEFTLRVQPSVPGLELYAWAAGESDVLPKDFGARHLTIETDSALRRLVDVALPRLIPVTAPEAGAAVEG